MTYRGFYSFNNFHYKVLVYKIKTLFIVAEFIFLYLHFSYIKLKLMKKITLLLLLFVIQISFSQTILFEDDFNDLDISDWTLYDEDGDGVEWSAVQIQDEFMNPVGTPVLRSASWNGSPLTPDNYAFSPAIDLTNETGNTITLTWVVTAADASFADENYTVYVATGNTVADALAATISFNEIVTDNGPGGLDNPYTKTLDISSLAGSVVYVAFRHHNVSDEFTIEIDDVTVDSQTLGTTDFDPLNFNYFVDAQNKLNLSANESFSSVKLFNLLGQEVLAKSLSNQNESIDINALNSGVYLAQVQISGKMETFKFVKK